MSIHYAWGDENHITMYITFEGSFTADEVFELMAALEAEIESAGHPVDMICEFDKDVVLPNNPISILPQIADTLNAAENLGKVYIIGGSGFLGTVLDVFSTVFFPLHYINRKNVNTLSEEIGAAR